MVVLKGIKHRLKVRGSTLMETLVATVLIVLVFMLASMILNNLFSNTIKHNTRAVENHLNELQYLHQHEQLQLPYANTFKNWNVTIGSYKENNEVYVEFEAVNPKTNKIITIIQSED